MVSLGGVSLVTLIGNSEEAGGRLTRLTQNSVSLPVASAALKCERCERGEGFQPGSQAILAL